MAIEESYDDCILDEARFFDPETGEWGYEVVCEHPDHRKLPDRCPTEREMFRRPARVLGNDGQEAS